MSNPFNNDASTFEERTAIVGLPANDDKGWSHPKVRDLGGRAQPSAQLIGLRTKIFFVFVLFFGLASNGSRAATLDLGSPTTHTPYDPYLAPMWKVLHSVSGGRPSIARVEGLVLQARAFHYTYKEDDAYVPQSPSVTESTRSGDCKAKSLWLAAKMRSSSVRFVIGKARLGDRSNHAWLIWRGPTGWLILDPADSCYPLSPQRLSAKDYVPLYSYSSNGRFAHTMSTGAPGAGAVFTRKPSKHEADGHPRWKL